MTSRITQRIRRYAAMMLVVLTIGAGQMRGADASSARIYYDNSTSGWSYVQILGGHSTWSSGTKLNKISNTNALWTNTWSWSGYTYFMFIDASGTWGGEGKEAWERRGYASHYSKTFSTNVGSNTYFYNSTSTDNNSGPSETKISSYSALNYDYTVEQKLTTDGGSSYALSTATMATTVKVSSYYLSAAATASATGDKTIAAGSSSNSCKAARTATVTYTVSGVQSGYHFLGWYDGDTQKSTSATYSDLWAVSNTTITARFTQNYPVGETLYLLPNSDWKNDGARFAAYFYGDGGDLWVDCSQVGTSDYYSATVPDGAWKGVIFCRMNSTRSGENNGNNWSNKWNQTDDLLYDAGNNGVEITGWDNSQNRINVVAKVTAGSTTTCHTSVESAITAANSKTNPTVTMLADATATEQSITQAMTIDLNGKTITSTEATATKAVFVVNASGKTVTITDSGSGGTIAHTASVSGIIYGISVSLGTLSITGGTIRATNNVSSGNTSHRAYGIYSSATAVITISGGTIEAQCPSNPAAFGIFAIGNLTMTGGTVTASSKSTTRGIYLQGTTTLSDATITATNTSGSNCYAIFANKGALTINSGTYTASGTSTECYAIHEAAGSVTINGGRFSGGTKELNKAGGTASISGGYYVHNTDLAANCAANYYVFDLAGQSPYLYEVAEGYTLTWTTDGDALTGTYTSGTTKVGTTITAPNTPTKTGYTFSAWSPSVAASMPSANATYTATWSPVTLHFTTAGNWSVASNWTPACVPTIAHPVILEKEAIVNVTDAQAQSVVIDQSSTKTGRLIVEPGKELVIATTLRKTTDGSAMSPTGENDVVINSTSILGLGALVMGSHDGTNKATVNFYTRSNGESDNNTSVGQYVGTPFNDETNILYNWYNSWVYGIIYPGGEITWDRVNEGQGMDPFRGYCVFSADAWDNAEGHSYWQQGTLNASTSVTCTGLNWQSGVGTANGNNENLLANSWMAPIKINKMEASDFTNADATVYIFNSTSNYAYYSGTGFEGNYTTHTVGTSTGVIPAMQSFSVFTNGSGASVKLDYDKIVYTPATEGVAVPVANSAPTRYGYTTDEADKMRLYILTESGYGDMLYMWERADFQEGFENGWDGRKLFGESYAPQLYAITPDGEMTINCVPTWEGSVIGFRAGSEDQMYTFAFEYEGDGTWYLNDLKAEQSTLITPANTYTFIAGEEDTDARFIISRTPIGYIPTDVQDSDIRDQQSDVKKVLIDGRLYIIRLGRMYDLTGAVGN